MPAATVTWRRMVIVVVSIGTGLAIRHCESRQAAGRDVPIIAVAGGDSIFPERCRDSLRAEPFITSGLGGGLGVSGLAVKQVIQDALDKYPPGFLRKQVQGIYLVRNLTDEGVNIGGTAIDRSVYINVPSRELRSAEDRAWTERSVHHELGHALMANGRVALDRRAWASTNVSGFRYGQGGLKYILHQPCPEPVSDDLLDSGFVSDYSRASLDEDFAEVVSVMFTADDDAWKLVLSKPRLRAKMLVAARFLQSLDPRLSWEYFENLHRRSLNMNTRLAR